MVVISKPIFDFFCRDQPCYIFIHPWTKSCLEASPTIFKDSLLGSAKFHTIVYLGQHLMSGRDVFKKEQLIKTTKNYLRSTVLAMIMSALGMQLICVMRNLLGRFSYYFYLSAPFALCGVLLGLDSPNRRLLITNYYCNLVIEYVLKYLNRAGFISITKTKIVLMFMMGSSLLLYLMRLEKENKSSVLWLLTPEKVKKQTDRHTNVCPHDGDCKKYILKDISKYFGVGLAISLAKVIIPRLKTPMTAISSIRGRHLKLALFVSSYIGIYKFMICYLCRKNGHDSALYALPAGFTAGLSMLFNPNLALAVAPFTAAFKLYSTTLYEKKILPSNIPLSLILFCICQGTLYSVRVYDSELAPRYMFYVMNTVTNGLSDSLYNRFSEKFKDVY